MQNIMLNNSTTQTTTAQNTTTTPTNPNPPPDPELALPNPPVPDPETQTILHDLTHSLSPWERYFDSLLVLSAVGCQITFAVIPSDISDPQYAANGLLNISRHTVRTFIACAFFFFLLTLSAAATGKTILANPTTRIRILRSVRRREYRALELLSIAACWIEYAPMLAYLFLGLAVAGYVPAVGFLVAGLFVLSLGLKLFYGHGVFHEERWRWSRLPAAVALLRPLRGEERQGREKGERDRGRDVE